MSGIRHLSVKSRRLLLGAFLLYLFGLLGYLGQSHRHEASHSQSDAGCQLCQISAQPFVAAEAPAGVLSAAVPLLAVATFREAALPRRHQPFSSRGPPSA